MTRSIYSQNSFVSGVLDPRLKGRTDIQQYFQGLEVAENVFILPQGGFRLAPGLVYIETLPEKSGGGVSPVRMFQFSISAARSYLLVFLDGKLRVYRDHVFLFEFSDTVPAAVPDLSYVEAEINEINEAQIDNVAIFAQKDRGFRRLAAPKDGLDDTDIANWSYDIPPITAPQIDYNDADSPVPVDNIQVVTFSNFTNGDTYKFMIDGIATEEIAYSLDSNSAAKNMGEALVNHPLLGNSGIDITSIAADQFRLTFSGDSAGDYEEMTGWATQSQSVNAVISFSRTQTGSSRKEDAWSDVRGYPRVITFFSGRTYVGNLPQRKSTLFASRSGVFFDFDLGQQRDDDAIFITIATDKLNEITNLVSGRNLQVFTGGAELFVPSEIPTPGNFEVRAQTNHGSSFVNPVQIDGATIFLEDKGKTLREYLFSFQEDSYLANSISVLAQQLIIDPVDMDAQKGTKSDDANYIIICNEDGTVTVLNTLRSQQISAFTRRITPNGKAIAVAVVNDEVYFTIERVINSVTVRYLEYWSYDSLMDSSLLKTFGSPTSVITGLDHLEGETVKVMADNSNLNTKTVSGGSITLERAATDIDIGLWQTPRIKPMPLAGDGGSGSNQMRIKKITRVSLRLFETAAIQFEGVTVPRRKFATALNSPLNTAPEKFTGVVGDIESNEGWVREHSPLITQEEPGPMTVLSLSYEMEAR